MTLICVLLVLVYCLIICLLAKGNPQKESFHYEKCFNAECIKCYHVVCTFDELDFLEIVVHPFSQTGRINCVIPDTIPP